jgi:hypothetical protein
MFIYFKTFNLIKLFKNYKTKIIELNIKISLKKNPSIN